MPDKGYHAHLQTRLVSNVSGFPVNDFQVANNVKYLLTIELQMESSISAKTGYSTPQERVFSVLF